MDFEYSVFRQFKKIKIKMKKFYYINNTCDHTNINVGGEILVVLDENKIPIWYHDYSDSSFEFPDALPREFMKQTGATHDSEFISIDNVDKKLGKEINKYLEKMGYSKYE
jgi:ribosome-associated translation inhibitor RaiA